MSQTVPCTDDEYVREWIAAFPLGEYLETRGNLLAEWPPLQVIIATFGTGFNRSTDGMRDMMHMILNDPVVAEDHPEGIPHVTSLYDKIPLYTNRIDAIFRSRQRQISFGRFVAGQAAFLRIYLREMGAEDLNCIFRQLWYRILDGIEDYEFRNLPFCHLVSCQHGHHRSQAVACLMQKLLQYHWEHVACKVYHMDDIYHTESHEMRENQVLRRKFVGGLRNAVAPPLYYVPLQREARSEDMDR